MAPTEQDKTAEKKQPEPKAEAAPTPATPADDKFPIERILSEECFAITGIERHIVAGALFETNKTALTKDEVQTAVSKWLASPVKED